LSLTPSPIRFFASPLLSCRCWPSCRSPPPRSKALFPLPPFPFYYRSRVLVSFAAIVSRVCSLKLTTFFSDRSPGPGGRNREFSRLPEEKVCPAFLVFVVVLFFPGELGILLLRGSTDTSISYWCFRPPGAYSFGGQDRPFFLDTARGRDPFGVGRS